MTNIFANKYTPVSESKALSKRYPIYITAYEKKVAEAQKEISDLSYMERPYNICREVLELHNLPHDINLELHSFEIVIRMKGQASDTKDIYIQLMESIGARLVEAKLRADPVGIQEWGGSYCRATAIWTWMREDANRGVNVRRVVLAIDIPEGGIRDLDVTKIPETINWVTTKFKLVERKELIPGTHMSATEVRESEFRSFRDLSNWDK
jgi:hypothetical protein